MLYWNASHTAVATERTGDVELYRRDLKSFEAAEEVASALTANIEGRTFIATDAGEWTSPRYDIAEPPTVGDEVSMAFNGDAYPLGKVVKVSESFRVITIETHKGEIHQAYRKRRTGSWIYRRTWSIVKGHHDKRNPSF